MKNAKVLLLIYLGLLLLIFSSTVKATLWTPPTQLAINTASDVNPSISGDGSKITFESYIGGDSEIFVIDENPDCNLTVAVNGSGSTIPSVGIHEYYEVTEIDVTAIPSSGWTFSHWLLNSGNVGSTNPKTVTVNTDNITLTAVFTKSPPEEIHTQFDYFSSAIPDFVVKVSINYVSFIDSDLVNVTETRQPGGIFWVVFNVTNGEIIETSSGYPSVFFHWPWWVHPESFRLGAEIILDSMPFGVGTYNYNVTGQNMIEIGTETYDVWEVYAELDIGDEYLPQKGTWWFDKLTGHLMGGIIENIPQGAIVQIQMTEGSIDYIPEFASWAILPLFIIATLVMAIIKKYRF